MLKLDITTCRRCGKVTGSIEIFLTRRTPIVERVCTECLKEEKETRTEGPISYESFLDEIEETK